MTSYFKLNEYKTNVKQEFIGGLTTFLATFYIIVVNPAILSQAGLSFPAVCSATVLIAAFSTILMGLYANNPIALAPGMGLNAFFTFGIVKGMNLTPQIALGIVFWSGIIFILLSIFKVREKIVELIPQYLRYSISCGIGLFIALIGFINGGVIIKHPATLIQMSSLNATTLTFIVSLIILAILVARGFKFSLIIGMLITFALAIPIGRFYGDASAINHGVSTLITWKGFIAMPDFSLFGSLDLVGSFKLSLVPVMLAFVFTDLFDTLSTLIGVSVAGELLDNKGNPRNLKKSLLVDAIATTASAVVGSSPTTSFIESASGVSSGARTGLASVFTGLLFLPFLFLSPLISMFPSFTTAPVLVMVGIFMLAPIARIDWKDYNVAIPSFLAMVLIPFSFSITHGIVCGIVLDLALRFFRKK